jgi:hypothetical protein
MQTKTELSPFAMPSLPYIANGQKLFHAASKLQAHAFKAVMSYQVETLAFLKHRCEQDVKLMDDLAASDEFNDAFDVVSNFVQNATAEYSTEVGKIASIGSRLASETAQRIRKEAENNIKEMALQTVA